MSQQVVRSTKKPSTVTTIKSQTNANKFVKDASTGSCIILYHWKSCGHCHSFMPIWEQIKQRFDSQKKIYEVEYDDMNTLLPQNLKMFSYPSIVSYNESKPTNFIGHSRTFDAVSDFINKYVKTVNQTLSTTQTRPKTTSEITMLPPKPRAKPRAKPATTPKPKSKTTRKTK
jgi:thiol-disulfide isomerase/thioredoxin